MLVPLVALGLAEAERILEIFEHPEIIERVDVAGDSEGERAHAWVSAELGLPAWGERLIGLYREIAAGLAS